MAKQIKITETVLRDSHQSLIATRMTTDEMLPILETMDSIGYYSLEAWGGATFDACLRFLNEDPWERLRKIRQCVKNNILPHIYNLNNSADKAFARMCTSLAADNEYLEGVANSLPEKMSRKELADLHGAILARYVKRRFEDCTGGKGLDAEAVAQIVEAIKDGKTVKYSVPCDLLAFISDSGLEFCPKNATRQELDSPLEWGENIISPIGYRIFITNDTESVNSFTKIYKPSILMKVKSDKITDGERLLARVRTRKTGDRYSYGKMHRDVRRQLISHKIPVQGRDRLPVLYTENDGIFLVTGLPLADGYNAKNGEKAVYIAISEM